MQRKKRELRKDEEEDIFEEVMVKRFQNEDHKLLVQED